MRGIVILTAVFMTAMGFAGCIGGGGPSGTLSFTLDDTQADVHFEINGIYAKVAGTGADWVQIAGNDTGAHWMLDGEGTTDAIGAGVPVGSYDLIQIGFAHIEFDGQEAILSESGFLLPLTFNVTEGTETNVLIGFAWADALFESQQGLAFAPAIKKVVITEDGVETVNLEAADIDVGGTKAPVARMRVLDEVWEIWQSDFLAESDDKRKKGTAGNLTFLASESEALAPGSTLANFIWRFDDGTTLEGATVNKVYDLNGGNFTVTLEVVDSNGVSDTQRLNLALQPGSEEQQVTYSLDGLTGLTPTGACTDGEKTFSFDVDPTMTPSGAAGGVASVVASAVAQAPHPQARIDLRVFDGEGGVVGAAASGGATSTASSRTATKNYDPAGAQPAAGTWVVHVQPCKAYDLTVSGKIGITWAGVGEPSFLDWYEAYDDGENR